MINVQRPSMEEEGAPKIDMTPMIDIVFTVIAFMIIIINTPLPVLDVNLPDANAETTDQTPPDTLLLHVLDTTWRIQESDELDQSNIKETLAQIATDQQDATIVISISQDAPTQRLVDTIQLLQAAGLKNTMIAMETTAQALVEEG